VAEFTLQWDKQRRDRFLNLSFGRWTDLKVCPYRLDQYIVGRAGLAALQI
jgi:hypothetical protein